MSRRKSVPSYRLHKPSGQAVVTVRTPSGGRRDVYLGPHDSKESRERYARLVTESHTPAGGVCVPPGGLTMAELMVRFLTHAEVWYRRDDGTQTSEVKEYKRTIRVVRLLYASLPVVEFGPTKLRAVQEAMIREDLARRVINLRVGHVKRIVKWGVSQELVPPAVHQALLTVPGLPKGRTPARETEPVGPVEWELVAETLPLLNKSVAAMVRLQWLTGMRSEEVCKLRTCDLDTAKGVWLYRPSWHKTMRAGRKRVIAFGPQAQEVLRPFLRPDDPGRVVFSPRDFPRGAWGKTRQPKATYNPLSYCDAIAKACLRNDLPHWHPHQLRHAFATAIRGKFGLDAAQAALGHAHADVTQVYAHVNEQQVVELAAQVERVSGLAWWCDSAGRPTRSSSSPAYRKPSGSYAAARPTRSPYGRWRTPSGSW